jgi:hypothetical protein
VPSTLVPSCTIFAATRRPVLAGLLLIAFTTACM